ncbi:hypothetical protein [Streptococcus gallolyticus]|uniref:hypothetical protein n=1 Tax=Streptococcus gallolyticus TaxID=315405 RepID=UPI002283BAEC|nr:hypothetical protein [Streptococcus gallolyticus]MCY7156674.1 hypothetical protein [Streptococcus gallolyticus subsp. gallolyticus]
MITNDKQSNLYTKYFELFTNDENGKYTQSSDNEEEELDDTDSSLTDSFAPNDKLKQDLEDLKALIKRELKGNDINKDRLNYSLITKEFYSRDANYDGFSFIQKLQRYLDASDEASDIIFKLLRHTELALVQKSSLSDRINDLEQQLNAQVNKSKVLTEKLEETNNEWNQKISDLDGQLKSLVTEIIGIMGVFATIIFAVFSGFNEITTLGGALSKTPVSKVMIYVGITFIVLIGIVFISYLAVGSFFEIDLRSCGCKIGDKCEHELIEKHPTVVAFIWLGLSFVAIGAILILYRDYINVFQINFMGYNLQILVLLFCLITVPIIGVYMILKKRISKFFSRLKIKLATTSDSK